METFTYQKLQKVAKDFYCKNCDYKCSKKSSWVKHCLTTKHQNTYFYLPNTYQKVANSKLFECECGKNYVHKQSLYNHKKICNFNKNISDNDKDLIMLLIKENSELKNMMMEQQNMMMKVIENGTHNTTNNNSHNKTFNLQLFLNETCKDAMNIMDFVESIQLQLSDLEKVGEMGFVEGISNIITSNLKALDVNKRPIHCADKKREILYVKDENKWEKEEEDKKKLRKAVKKIISKNQRMLPVYKQEHPDCIKSSSPFSDQYNKMIIESMGGVGNNDLEKEDKIIKKITKEVVIDKQIL